MGGGGAANEMGEGGGRATESGEGRGARSVPSLERSPGVSSPENF